MGHTFAIKWEIKDETLLQLAYYKLRAKDQGILGLSTTDDLVEMAAEVLLYQDYWNQVIGKVAVQFCDVGLEMCGIEEKANA
jgi:hypothetical protein